MPISQAWLLPEGLVETLPDDALRLERLRRALLDRLISWGYELVMPPLMEFLDALLTGLGTELDLQTIKITDQVTGRLMGIRADMTPQAARIDAHYLRREGVTRLCYAGPVLRSRPAAFTGSREPLQLGAEIFGHGGLESEIEIIELALSALSDLGMGGLVLDLGHVGVYRALIASAGLTGEREAWLRAALQRKARPDVAQALADWRVGERDARALEALCGLHGEAGDVLLRAQVLAPVPGASEGLERLSRVVKRLSSAHPDTRIYVDLGELQGYAYYTGLMFSVFVPGEGAAIAVGGRYDDIGRAFGRARAAVGFGVDLRRLAGLAQLVSPEVVAIGAPADDAPELAQAIAALRAKGRCVVRDLPGGETDPRVRERLVRRKDGWTVIAIEGD